jgi:hypothetical protein
MSDSGGERQVNQILYADDTALIADKECELKKLVIEFGRLCERRKLSVNVAKSKVMMVTRMTNVGDIDVTLHGIRMEEVDCFRYLGVDIDRDGSMKSEMKQRVTEGEKFSGVLRKMWKGERLSSNAKRSIYKGIVVPTLLYGSEVWATSAEDRRRMGVMEIKCMRAMHGVKIMDSVKNKEVQKRCGSELSIGVRMDGKCAEVLWSC